ncbi:hypothetical protein NKH71_03160 [Mesorhizobium sp. M0983]|uniref:hypothetical protein n=1 Tax=Mesorhizobium sp. M0983 TaxID=2957040 RepID=UPI00333B1765
MGGSLSAPEPAGLYYRFSVKCGREMNAAIEKAAKAAGMSSSSFVQKHFDDILSTARQPIDSPPPLVPAADGRRDFDVAQSLGITVTTLRLYRAMDHAKDGNGNVQMSQLALAEAAGVAPASVKTFQQKLAQHRLVKQVAPPGHRIPAIWHVYSIGDDR